MIGVAICQEMIIALSFEEYNYLFLISEFTLNFLILLLDMGKFLDIVIFLGSLGVEILINS